MNSYMLPQGTPRGGQPAQHDAQQEQRDAGIDQCQPGLSDALVERASRCVGDDAGVALSALTVPAATSSRSATLRLRA